MGDLFDDGEPQAAAENVLSVLVLNAHKFVEQTRGFLFRHPDSRIHNREDHLPSLSSIPTSTDPFFPVVLNRIREKVVQK